MPKEFSRTRRVAEQMQRELAQLIQFEIKDPRVGMVTVSAVEVSKDLSVAKVFISTLGDEQELNDTVVVLDKAAGFLRHELGRRMTIRAVPELRFHIDKSIAQGRRLSDLIDQAVERDNKEHQD